MILILEVIVASIAAILSVLSLKTLKTIKHLGVGKSFWIPIAVSGVLFIIGPTLTILHEADLSLTTRTDEVVQTSQLFALCTLLVGIYSYSRKVTKNLAQKLIIPEKVAKESPQTETPLGPSAPITHALPPIQERIIQEPETETAHECKYQFGYLRTLPSNASIPDECIGCDRIIECKHSLVNTIESRARSPHKARSIPQPASPTK